MNDQVPPPKSLSQPAPLSEDLSRESLPGGTRRATVLAGLGVAAAAGLIGWGAREWVQRGGWG